MADINTLKRQVKFKSSTSAKIKLQVGKKNYTVPVEVRSVIGAKYVYVSLPLSNGFYEMSGRSLKSVDYSAELDKDITAAANKPKPVAKKAVRAKVELPGAVVAQLMKSIPAGHKLAVKDGVPVVVKSRVRRAPAKKAKK